LKRLVATALAAVGIAAFGASGAGASLLAPNDPNYSRQWGLQKIQAEQAWPVTNGSGAVVAVVDSGVDLTHPDLQANILNLSDADMVEPDGTCTGGGQGRTCTQDGAQDKNGHGTHVAGIVGAITNNGVGVAGVAPGATILPVRVLDENGEGSTDEIAAGVRYATDHGADVINLSLGFLSGQGEVIQVTGLADPVYDAIDYAWSHGAVVVVAAGNDSVPLCAEPASAANVLCIGASDSHDLIASYSNSDASTLDTYLTAPGGDGLGALSLGPNSPTAVGCGGEIFSTYLRGADTWCSSQAGYEGISGTSMAAPHVSGVAALLSSLGLSNTEIVDCLKVASDDLGVPGRDPIYGYGRLNAAKAVTTCAE
jgi:subtilisin family serine protease